MGLRIAQDGWHGGYDLRSLNMPEAAYPQRDRPLGNKGKHSYTVEDRATGGRIEVLLRARAFYVKKIGGGPEPADQKGLGQVGWRNDVKAAWACAKERANFS